MRAGGTTGATGTAGATRAAGAAGAIVAGTRGGIRRGTGGGGHGGRAGAHAGATSEGGTTWTQRCLGTVTVKTNNLGLVIPPRTGVAPASGRVGKDSMLLDPRSP